MLGAVLTTLYLVSSCRDPTEITLEITSNACGSLKQTGIAVGPAGNVDPSTFSATQDGCQRPGYVGSIVVLPSGSSDDAVGIEIVGGLGKPPGSCTHGDPQCIVARRSLRYLPHTPLTLPITLELSCAGVACDDPSTTCLSGACVPSTINPDACLAGSCTIDAGVDAARLDATLDAKPDAPITTKDATLDVSTGTDATLDSSPDVNGGPDATADGPQSPDSSIDSSIDSSVDSSVDSSFDAPGPG